MGIIIVALAAVVQYNVMIAGVTPNLLFAALIALAFCISDFTAYALIAVFGVLVMRAVPGFSLAAFFALLLFWGAFWVRRALPWRTPLNALALLLAVPIAWYLVTDAIFLFTGTFLMELGYTVVAGFLILFVCHDENEQ